MATSHFTFLAAEWPDVYDPARRAERMAHADARAACFYARRTLVRALRHREQPFHRIVITRSTAS